MGSQKRSVVYGLTPQQQKAADILLEMAVRNSYTPQRYPGTFAPDLGDLDHLGSSASGLQQLGVDPNTLKELIQTGFPAHTTDVAQQARDVGRAEMSRAYEDVLARAASAGGAFGSAARGAATKAAVGEMGKYELGALGQVLSSQEQAANRRVSGLQLATQVAQAAQSMGLDAARIKLAAQQFAAGMDYEEWKRNNPDVMSILGLLFGRNVDTHLREGASWVGPALQAIATIVGASIMASDARLKAEIEPIEDGVLEKIAELRPVRYEWRDVADDDWSRVGFIAQDLAAVFPEVVHTGLRGYLYVDYPHFAAILVKAIQELKAEVDRLRVAVRGGDNGNHSIP